MSDDKGGTELDVLVQLSISDFIAGWHAIVGEPPAIMLESRVEMIRLLVESTPTISNYPNQSGREAKNNRPREPE